MPNQASTHVPYFQETAQVAVILQIKPPSEELLMVFDLQDFPPPTEVH
jgi:hypothetical protein